MKRNGVLFISGDVHFGEITRYDCALDYPLYDITSSGLTQSIEEVVPPSLRFLVSFITWLTPSTMRVKSQNCRYQACIYGIAVFFYLSDVYTYTHQVFHALMFQMLDFCFSQASLILELLR